MLPKRRLSIAPCVWHFQTAATRSLKARVAGTLVWPIRGEYGFGFDPMFLPDGEAETFGEMKPTRKHAMSHRAAAFKKFVAKCFD